MARHNRRNRGQTTTGSIQEVKTKEGDVEKLDLPANYTSIDSSMKSKHSLRQRGVLTLVHKRLAARIIERDIIRVQEGRFLAVPITTLNRQQRIWIINIYAPASQQESSKHILQSQQQDQDMEEDSEVQDMKYLEEEKKKFFQTTLRHFSDQVKQNSRAQDIHIKQWMQT